MNAHDLYNAGTVDGIIPEGDAARQAVDSLRGYAYQVLAATLAWLDIDEDCQLFLEVAEDYATIAKHTLDAVQVKYTKGSGSVTLNSEDIRNAVVTFIDLFERNPDIQVELRYFTTSEIGKEQAIADRPAGMAGLKYWCKVASGADLKPLRSILESEKFPESVRDFARARCDTALRRDLIKRIRWDCGKPDFSTLRHRLEERLIVVGRDRFKLPAAVARGLADLLLYQVLKKSIAETSQDRVLTRGALYSEIDAATQISVSQWSFDALVRSATRSMAGMLKGDSGLSNPISISDTEWLIDGTTLPAPQGMVPRAALESAVADALRNFGAGVIVGSSGLGKSNLSRAAAVAHPGTFHMVGFRDIGANETSRILEMVLARFGGLQSSVLILDDLNQIDDTYVKLSLARVIEGSRRNNRVVLVTCDRRPSSTTLAKIGLNQGCVVECPYFSEKEVCSLVIKNGGDPKRWGKLAYIAGAAGHPQLTHAFVIGMATRRWPASEFRDLINRGMSTEEIDATRLEVRRSLVSRLPEETRNLLYRLSLTIGRFNRSTALAIGEIRPQLSRAGESIDQLVGPWIEPVGQDLFRVSPLASSIGREMLSPDVQQRIHEILAVQMLRKRTIDARDADTILAHAILGKSPQSLFSIAQGVLSADPLNVEMLSEQFLLLRFARADVPILADDPFVSGIVRLAQFKLAAATGKSAEIAEIATTFYNEIRCMPAGELKSALEAMGVFVVLGTMGVANHIDNWVTLLLEFKTSGINNAFFQDRIAGAMSDLDGLNYVDALFDLGSAGLTSIGKLEQIINELDKLNESDRALLLTQTDETSSDYSVLINGTWAAQTNRADFDACDAAVRYQRMAKMTRSWGIRTFSLQCSVAQAVILDEHENKKDRAVEVLNETATALGDDPILRSALANIHSRHHENQAAFEIYRSLADHVGGTDPAERAFLLRKAAMSAAKCDEWSLAATWFLDAQSAAELAEGDTMDAFAIGLGADSAVAALKAGNVVQAFKRLADSLQALADVDPEATLQATYCHLVIRQTVLWAQFQIEGSKALIGGERIGMEPGSCSNPSPSPAIREQPLAHIDVAWYMLAKAEATADIDAGISATLVDRLAQGPIPAMEVDLRTKAIQAHINRLDAKRFTAHFMPYVESAVYLSKETRRFRPTFDPLAPERGLIPALDENQPFDSAAEEAANDAIIAYGIISSMKEQPDAMKELENALECRFTGQFPGKQLFAYWHKKTGALSQLDQTVVTIAKTHLRNEHVEPYFFWMTGLRFFERINQSMFKDLLTPRLAAWQRAGWKRIIAVESFRLTRPRHTVPPIEKILAIPVDDRRFVARLLLATSEAVDSPSPLGSAYRRSLKAMARNEESHKE